MNKEKNHSDPPRILKANKDDLLKFVTEMRDTGIPINARMVQLETARINHSFHDEAIMLRNQLWRGF